MANLTSIEKRQFEDLFCMSNGYVLDYSDNSFRELFRSVVNVNIDAQQYLYNGTSKAKKLRAFWEQEPEKIVGKILRELLDVWKYIMLPSQLFFYVVVYWKEFYLELLCKIATSLYNQYQHQKAKTRLLI